MINRIKNLLDLSKIGVRADYEDDVSRRIVFSNIVFISLPAVYLISMAIDYEAYLTPIHKLRFDQFVVPIVILVCLACLWLNYLGRTTISRILFIGLWPLLLHLIPIKLLQTPADYYLAFPLGIVFHSMLIQLMFSYRKERVLFGFWMALNLVGMLFSPNILSYYDTDRDIPKAFIDDKYYFFDGLLYWLLFNLVTLYILYIIDTYIKQINTSKELIEQQKGELNVLNQNLELLVSQRTLELEQQNEKLKKHAYFNAHLLRGPFCRVQGLLHLQNLGGSDLDEKKLIKSKLNESIVELDGRIREIQRLVETEEERIE